MGQFVTLEFVPFAEGGVALETGVRLVAGHDANHGRRGRRLGLLELLLDVTLGHRSVRQRGACQVVALSVHSGRFDGSAGWRGRC